MIQASYTEGTTRGFQYRGEGDREQAWAHFILALSRQRRMQNLLDDLGLWFDTKDGLLRLMCIQCGDKTCYTHQTSAVDRLTLAILDSPALSRIMADHEFIWREV